VERKRLDKHMTGAYIIAYRGLKIIRSGEKL